MKRRYDLLIGPREKAIEAVKAGNKAEAIKYIEGLSLIFKPVHDRYIDWIEYLLEFVADRVGEEAVGEADRLQGGRTCRPGGGALPVQRSDDRRRRRGGVQEPS